MNKKLKLLGAVSAFILTSCSFFSKMDFSNNPWGEKAAKECFENVNYVIPYLESNEFEYETGKDDYGDPMIAFYLYYDSEEEANSAFSKYTEICAYENGFAVSIQTQKYVDWNTLTYFLYDVAYADKVIGKNLGVEIVSTVSMKNNKDCLGLFVYNYLYIDSHTYPQLAIEELFGSKIAKTIPQITGEEYEYYFTFYLEPTYNSKALEIQISGGGYTLEEEYFDILLAKDYIIFDNFDDSDTPYNEYPGYEDDIYYYAYAETHIICFDYDIYNDVFIIDFFQMPN